MATNSPCGAGLRNLRRCWQEISETLDSARPVSNISRLTVRLNDLFLLLLDILRENKPRLDDSLTSSRRTVHLFLNDLKAHPENLAIDWGVEEMATSCGLGVSQFMQHVRRLTNMTPVQFLTHCRLELAARLLREQRAAHITDIALDCGFASSQYFATVFSRHYGCSPREFRASRAS